MPMTQEQSNGSASNTGLSPEQVAAHLEQFSEMGSFIVKLSAYEMFIEGRAEIGMPDNSCYILPGNVMSDKLELGDTSRIEEALGFPDGYFGNEQIVRVDIASPHEHNIRMASGDELGGNAFFNTDPVPKVNQSKVVGSDGRECDETREVPSSEGLRVTKKVAVFSAEDNKPEELAKLKGAHYVKSKNPETGEYQYTYHKPDLSGYEGKTSGGLPEAVIDRVQNTPQIVKCSTFYGKRTVHQKVSMYELMAKEKIENQPKILTRTKKIEAQHTASKQTKTQDSASAKKTATAPEL